MPKDLLKKQLVTLPAVSVCAVYTNSFVPFGAACFVICVFVFIHILKNDRERNIERYTQGLPMKKRRFILQRYKEFLVGTVISFALCFAVGALVMFVTGSGEGTMFAAVCMAGSFSSALIFASFAALFVLKGRAGMLRGIMFLLYFAVVAVIPLACGGQVSPAEIIIRLAFSFVFYVVSALLSIKKALV